MAYPHDTTTAQRRAHWIRVRRLTAVLLAAWFLATFGVIFFARELSGIVVFGWPLSFYMAAQGTILLYVLIVAYYAWRMGRLDRMTGEEGQHGE